MSLRLFSPLKTLNLPILDTPVRNPKRGLVYEKQIFPKHCYGECVTAPETESRIVYSFDKVTLAKGQVFRIYFYEDGGPRNFVLSFGVKDLNK